MFRCDQCKEVQAPRTKAHKVIIRTREKRYSNAVKDGMYKLSIGQEIAREATVCPKCAGVEKSA